MLAVEFARVPQAAGDGRANITDVIEACAVPNPCAGPDLLLYAWPDDAP